MVLLLTKVALAHGVPVVLVIYDTANSDTTTLCADLLDQNSDMSCSLSDTDETGFDGTNPSLSSYDVVVHMTGTTTGDMPAAGQAALVGFVQGGGGYLHFEYAATEHDGGHYSSMRDLILFDGGASSSGTQTWTEVSSQAGHRALYTVPASFSFASYRSAATLHSFSSSPSTTLMTDGSGAPAVAVREFSGGRIIGFNSAGNKGSKGVFADSNVSSLIVDAILWAGACDEDVDGHRSYACYGLDCDDADPTVYWGADEVCNSVDDDCDLSVDESAIDATTWYEDSDGDSYGDVNSYERACDQPTGFVENYDDCDDSDSSEHPGADEYCDNADDDCDGSVDESGAVDAQVWYVDADGDGYGDASGAIEGECLQPSGSSDVDTDCDDSDGDSWPGAVETPYDGVDQDCDGADLCDVDLDGFDAEACGGADCDDQAKTIKPGASEIWYDGVDQNCNGDSDYDADRDLFDSKSYGGLDCDDADPDKYPGAPDDPYDGIVHDCDASDEFDGDADGYKSDAYGGDDCDDASSAIHPGQAEFWYDGVDRDCDGASDFDADQDLFDSMTYGGEDCDDGRAEVNPDQVEVWDDGIDQDCDGEDHEPEVEDTSVPEETDPPKDSPEPDSKPPEDTRCGHVASGGWLLGLLLLRARIRS